MTEQAKVRTAFTKDERGILNNWAIEPKMYIEEKAEKQVKKQVANQDESQDEKRFGLTEYAELLNGRVAMVGFVILFVAELVTGRGFLQIIGF